MLRLIEDPVNRCINTDEVSDEESVSCNIGLDVVGACDYLVETKFFFILDYEFSISDPCLANSTIFQLE